MKVVDHRCGCVRRVLLVDIPDGAIFQGCINDYSFGTFKKNGVFPGFVFELSGSRVWDLHPSAARTWYCDLYQRVHGTIHIERNA